MHQPREVIPLRPQFIRQFLWLLTYRGIKASKLKNFTIASIFPYAIKLLWLGVSPKLRLWSKTPKANVMLRFNDGYLYLQSWLVMLDEWRIYSNLSLHASIDSGKCWWQHDMTAHKAVNRNCVMMWECGYRKEAEIVQCNSSRYALQSVSVFSWLGNHLNHILLKKKPSLHQIRLCISRMTNSFCDTNVPRVYQQQR